MTAPFLFPPLFRQFDNAGLPAAGYLLYTWNGGTTTPKTTYSDAAGTIPNTNPVVLDSTGSATVRLGTGSYNFALKTPDGTTTIWSEDDYDSPNLDIGSTLYPQTASELAVGVTPANLLYPPGNVLRYGLIPNSSGAATNNTAFLRALVSYNLHATGWTGGLTFPNTTGADVYYFNNYLDFRPGIDVDLQWCTLNFAKAATDSTDPNSGFVSAIRDFTLKNGYIVVNYTCANGGHGLMFGARGADGTYFVPIYDSTLAQPMGNIRVNNVKVSSNNPGNRCIFMFGGLQNVSFDNVWIDGANVCDGVYYEFGWATDAGGVLASRQTSHAHNLSFKNFKATNISTTGLGAITCNGAYNWSVDGLEVITSSSCIGVGFGESYFYNPWTGVDDGAVNKRGATLRNIVGKGITGTGISISGANASAVVIGYLAATINALATPAKWIAQSDLLSVIIDSFVMNGTANANGIQVQGAQYLEISNGRVNGFQHGINTTDEVTLYSIRNTQVIASTNTGIIIGAAADVWTPARLSMGKIEGCFVLSSGQVGANSPGITVGNTQYCLIKGNRIGSELIHDGSAETTQTVGVLATATALNVICDSNYVNTSGGAVAYQKTSGPGGCQIINPMGLATLTGAWQYGGAPVMATLAYSASMTPDCTQASEFIVNPSNGVAFTINAPLNPMTGMLLTFSIRNATGGALGAVTWNAAFKMSAWTQPANTFNRSITFKYDGAAWIQVNQTGVDVPN